MNDLISAVARSETVTTIKLELPHGKVGQVEVEINHGLAEPVTLVVDGGAMRIGMPLDDAVALFSLVLSELKHSYPR